MFYFKSTIVCYANDIRRECVKLIFRLESTNPFHEPVCLSQALLSSILSSSSENKYPCFLNVVLNPQERLYREKICCGQFNII